MHLNQILPQLFVGSCPTSADDIDHLKADYGITAILNLQTDHDFDYWDLDWNRIEARCRALGIDVRRIPVRDFDGLDLRKRLPDCVRTLDELLRDGRTVYIHCNVGTGRSPSARSLPTCTGSWPGTSTMPSSTSPAAVPARPTSKPLWRREATRRRRLACCR